MKKRKSTSGEKVLCSVSEMSEREALGESTVRRLAKESGAGFHIGRRYLIKVSVFDEYMESIRETESSKQTEIGAQ